MDTGPSTGVNRDPATARGCRGGETTSPRSSGACTFAQEREGASAGGPRLPTRVCMRSGAVGPSSRARLLGSSADHHWYSAGGDTALRTYLMEARPTFSAGWPRHEVHWSSLLNEPTHPRHGCTVTSAGEVAELSDHGLQRRVSPLPYRIRRPGIGVAPRTLIVPAGRRTGPEGSHGTQSVGGLGWVRGLSRTPARGAVLGTVAD